MKHLSRLAWLFLACAVGCGSPSEQTETPGGEEPLGPPPQVSGAFHWYADLTPAVALANGFAVAPDGRTALAFSPVKAGTVAGVPFAHFGPGTTVPNYDLLVAMLDSSGKAAWVKTFSTVEIEAASSLAIDDAGDVYLSGIFKDNVDGLDFGNGVTVGIGPGEISSFLVKLRGTDGVALWATALQSGDRYVQPTCGFKPKAHAVRGSVGALGCVFDAGDGTRGMKVVTKAGDTSIAAAGPRVNAAVMTFNPSNGQPTGSYVIGGVNAHVHTLAISKEGGIVMGARLSSGTASDSAASAPLVLGAPSCLVVSLNAELKPVARRAFGGGGDSDCELGDVAIAGPDRILIGGDAEGNVDFGDGVASSGSFGFTGALRADLSNAGTFERFAGESVFGVTADAWGQSFVGISEESSSPSFRYTKRDAAGQVVFESKEYTPDANASRPYLQMMGLGTDRSGNVSVFGGFSGAFLFDDGVHGNDENPTLFTLRFAP